MGSDGNVYSTNATLPSGVTKRAMIGYVSETGHGIAIELNSSPSTGTWYVAQHRSMTAVTGGTWRMPSLADWQNMVTGCGGAEGFITKYDATGVSLYLPESSDQRGPTQFWTSDYIYGEDYVVGEVFVPNKYDDVTVVELSVTDIQSTPQYSFRDYTVRVPKNQSAPSQNTAYSLYCLAF